MGINEALDELFKDVKFNKRLVEDLTTFNISFITSNHEVRDLIGGKLLGCYKVSYTQYHKDIFYEDLFGFSYDTVKDVIKKIKDIPTHFKVARDDINLVCFYIAHRFMTEQGLDKKVAKDGVDQILNYFGYRTLILLNANYWIYPITKDKAVTLYESLNNGYKITSMKNWNEYVGYRTDVFLNSSNNVKALTGKKIDGKVIPNVINSLYNGYKDMMKNVYRQFLELEDNNTLRSSRNVVTDLEGREMLLDKLNDPRKSIDKVKNAMVSRDLFIKGSYIEVSSSIIQAISIDQLKECLELVLTSYYQDRKIANKIDDLNSRFINDVIDYLQNRKEYINNDSNVVEIVNTVVGNILFSRGGDLSITIIKDETEKVIKDVYKKGKVYISSRNLTAMRNIYLVYILLLALL